MSGSTGHVILGCGGHAAVVADALLALGHAVLGCVDRHVDPNDTRVVLGLPVLGDEAWLEGQVSADFLLVNGLGGGNRTSIRGEVFQRWIRKGFQFAGFVHPSAVIGRDVVFGSGVQVMAGAVIQPRCHIGDDVLVNTGARIDHDCVLEAHAHVAPGATLCGGVSVGEGVMIGAGAVLLPGARVEAGWMVPARPSEPRQHSPRDGSTE